MDPADVDPAIRAYLGEHHTDLIAQSLAYGAGRYRCPACGQPGDANTEASGTGTVLYHQIAMAGGYSGEFSLDGFAPPQPTLVRWWLTRTHPTCQLPALLDWPQLPGWARPGASPAAAPTGTGPALGWTAYPAWAGFPVLVLAQHVPVAHVTGIDTQRLVDVAVETLQQRGANILTADHLRLDNLLGRAPLRDWYAHLQPDRLTVWTSQPPLERMVADVVALLTGRIEDQPVRAHQPVRAPLATLAGLPGDWLDTADAAGRILLVLHTTAGDFVDATRPPWDRATRALLVGGIVTVGRAADPDRPAIITKPAIIARPPLPPIDVGKLWRQAHERAEQLTTAYRTDPAARTLTADPTELLALVLTAAARADDGDPLQVSTADLAARLAGDGLRPWLQMMLEPTTAIDRLRATDRLSDRLLFEPLRSLFDAAREAARAVAERQRLLDAGSLRLGDLVRWVQPDPAGHTPGALHAVPAIITGVSFLTWDPRPTPAGNITYFDLELRRERGYPYHLAPIFDLLLDDDADPRALPHAAYAAATALWCQQPTSDTPHLDAGRLRAVLRNLEPHHRHSEVRHILHTVIAATDRDAESTREAGIEALRVLAHHPVPGCPTMNEPPAPAAGHRQ